MTKIFILVDALGWELVATYGFLDTLLPFRKPLRTVFGFSSAAIPSILTGLRPDTHGHWNLFYFRPDASPFRWLRHFCWLPKSWINHRVPRKLIALLGRRLSGADAYFSIYGIPVQLLPYFDICEKHNIFDVGGLLPARSVFDDFNSHNIPYRVYTYHAYTDRAAVQQVRKDLANHAARIYFVYLCELDAFLHVHIDSEDAVRQQLRRYADDIAALLETAVARDADTAFYVFSDHGMTPVRERVNLRAVIHELGWREPQDYLALYDSTMARFWFFNASCREAVTRRLETLPCGRILTAQDREQLGLAFSDARFGELIFAMRPGAIISPSYMGLSAWPGMHGFDPDHVSSLAVLLARREPPVPVDHICHIYDLMRHEAGI